MLGYARVSSEEQARGSSLGDQQNALKAYAAARGLTLDHIYVESESGIHERFERREQIQLLMRDLRQGDLVLVDKIDRWSRDPEFTYRSMREIREAGTSVFFVGEQIDPSTAEGDSMLTFRVAFAREEHKRIKQRTVGTRKLLRDRGYYVEGLPPLGYERSLPRGQRGPETKNTLRIRDEDAALVRDIFTRCLRGESIGDICKHLARVRPRRSWDKKSIGSILRNRVYLGEIENSEGVWIKARHPAIITRDVFARAAQALESRKLGGAKPQAESLTAGWLLRQIGVCARCGSKLSAAYGGGTGPGKYAAFYYRCGKRPKGCAAPYIPVGPADEATGALVLPRLVELRSALAKGPEQATNAPKVVDYAERKAKLQRKRERFLEAFGDGDMTREELRGSLAKLDAERLKIETAEAAQSRQAPLQSAEVRRTMLGQASELARAWRGAGVAARRKILRALAWRVRVEKSSPPDVVWRSLEEMALEAPASIRRAV